MIEITDTVDIDPADVQMAKHCADALLQAYPGHEWMVHCDGRNGVMVIKHLRVDPRYGYVIHLSSIFSASEAKRLALGAGGEILERFRIPRSKAIGEQLDGLPADARGMLIGDVEP